MMIFFIFANFSTSRKNWRFSPPRPWGPFSLISHLCPDFIQMSEFLYLSCPDVRLWWFSSFSQTFPLVPRFHPNEWIFISRKNWRFSPPRPWGPFSLISHLCPDFIQMSEFLYLSCPDDRLWWFSSFSQTFPQVEKIEDFPHPGPGDPFRLFHTCAQISSKWVNFYILVVLMSDYDDFLHFRKLFHKSKKLVVLMSNYDEDFPHPGPGDPFRLFHTCAQISSKWVNFYILVVLMSDYDDFLHFRKLFHKSKKLKIFPTPALGTLFAYFTLVPRFHPNEWIFIS